MDDPRVLLDACMATIEGWSKPSLPGGRSRSWRKTRPDNIQVLCWADQSQYYIRMHYDGAQHDARTKELDQAVRIAERWASGENGI